MPAKNSQNDFSRRPVGILRLACPNSPRVLRMAAADAVHLIATESSWQPAVGTRLREIR